MNATAVALDTVHNAGGTYSVHKRGFDKADIHGQYKVSMLWPNPIRVSVKDRHYSAWQRCSTAINEMHKRILATRDHTLYLGTWIDREHDPLTMHVEAIRCYPTLDAAMIAATANNQRFIFDGSANVSIPVPTEGVNP